MHTTTRFFQFLRTRWYLLIWFGCILIKFYSLTRNIHTIGQVMQDTGAYYGAGFALNQGISPYHTAAWQPLLPDITTAPYIYPPFWAVLWRLPATWDWAIVRWGMTVLNLVIFGASIVVLGRQLGLTRRQSGVLLLSFVVSVPLFGVFFLGQVRVDSGLVDHSFGGARPQTSILGLGLASGLRVVSNYSPSSWFWPSRSYLAAAGALGSSCRFGTTISQLDRRPTDYLA
jgi:hypothetical protein